MSSEQLLQILKTQLLQFLDQLIEILPSEQEFIVIRFFIKDQIPITDIMNYIIAKLVPLEEYVLSKDERFFLEHRVLFEDLRNIDANNDHRVSHFKNLWINSTDSENKEIIWNWFRCFIQIAKRYQAIN